MNYFTQRATRVGKAAFAVLAIAMLAVPASAAAFTGSLSISGNFALDDGMTLGSTSDLFFPGNDFDVDTVSGDFSGLAGISQLDFGGIADLDLGLSGGPLELLSISGVTFTVESISISAQTNSFLLFSGLGYVTYNGMDTAAALNFSANTIGGSSNFSAGITAVPVPGAVWLLGSALMALGLRRRR